MEERNQPQLWIQRGQVLVPNLLRAIFWNLNPVVWRERSDRTKRWTTPNLKVASLISERIYIWVLSWVASKQVDLHTHSPAGILKVYIDAFPGFSHVSSPGSLHAMFLSQGCILRAASGSRESKQNTNFKDREGSGETPVAWVQLVSQQAVTSSWWSSPTASGTLQPKSRVGVRGWKMTLRGNIRGKWRILAKPT